MSSKKKSGRSDWCTCQACKLLVTNKDWAKHLSVCAGRRGKGSAAVDGSFLNESTDSLDSGKSRVEYGYIDNGVLHAVVCLPAEKGSEKLMPASRENLVHLNPETMHICGLHIGRPVILTNSTVTVPTIATAWPVSNFPAASAGLPAAVQETSSLTGGDMLCVESVKCPTIAAKAVKIICRDHTDDSTFRSYLIGSLNGKLILPGSRLHVNYLGKPCKLIVWSITGIDEQEVCCSQLENVSMSGDQIFDQSEGPDSNVSVDTNSVSTSERSCEVSGNRTQSVHSNSTDPNSSKTEPEPMFSPERNTLQTLATSTPKRTNTSRKPDGESMDSLSTSLHNLKFSDSPNSSGLRRKHLHMIFKLTMSTELVLVSKLDPSGAGEEESSNKLDAVTYGMIGGLHRQLKTIRETLEVPLTNPDLFKTLGVTPPRGVLLYGPPGVGKTMIARAVAHEAGAHVIIINGPEVMSKYYGESEAKLRSIFQEGSRNAPCLVFIDELDALCPKRDKVQSELEKRIVATLLTLMDGMGSMQSKGHLMVLGATNRPDAIDPALRRPGRFDREIEIGVPNAQERLDILQKCLAPIQHTVQPDDLQHIASTAHGYVGADLSAVCKEAAMHAFEQQKKSMTDSQLEGKVHVTFADLTWALKEVRPSAMREVEIDVPKVYWSDIGGLESIKLKLKQAVEWPIKHPDAFKRMGITPPRGILMYGPPGCSKTLIAKALATESGLNFIAVKGPELFNKWVGESERAVREVFRKARMASPSIVFFDEIDALAVERGSASGGNNVGDRVLGQLLTEIDGVEGLQDVTVVAATNRPDIIDKALMRPGRLDRILYVSLPDALTRREIFRIQFRRMPIYSDVSLEDLVSATENYSGAEVVSICREAGLSAMQEDIDIENVYRRHFEHALKIVKPRTTSEAIRYYEEYQQDSGVLSI